MIGGSKALGYEILMHLGIIIGLLLADAGYIFWSAVAFAKSALDLLLMIRVSYLEAKK